MQNLSSLRNNFPARPDFKFINLSSDYPAIVIDNAHAKATIALHGAHLIDFTPHGEEPVIFTSKSAIYREGKAIRGGIPICWPWFNAHPSDSSLPSHGYARTSFWTLEKVSSHAAGTSLLFTLPSPPNSNLSATLEFNIGKTLTLTLTTTNESTQPETYSEALHAYFCVTDSRQAQLHGLEGRAYIDTVGVETSRSQAEGEDGVITFPDEVDRLYHHDTDATIKDIISPRDIHLSKAGSDTTITWNPGVKKGQAMADLHDDEIHQFICVEAGNARNQSITLDSGQEHSIHYRISTKFD